jgi:hypothetical protein
MTQDSLKYIFSNISTLFNQNQITFQTHVIGYQNHKGAKFKDGQHSR